MRIAEIAFARAFGRAMAIALLATCLLPLPAANAETSEPATYPFPVEHHRLLESHAIVEGIVAHTEFVPNGTDYPRRRIVLNHPRVYRGPAPDDSSFVFYLGEQGWQPDVGQQVLLGLYQRGAGDETFFESRVRYLMRGGGYCTPPTYRPIARDTLLAAIHANSAEAVLSSAEAVVQGRVLSRERVDGQAARESGWLGIIYDFQVTSPIKGILGEDRIQIHATVPPGPPWPEWVRPLPSDLFLGEDVMLALHRPDNRWRIWQGWNGVFRLGELREFTRYPTESFTGKQITDFAIGPDPNADVPQPHGDWTSPPLPRTPQMPVSLASITDTTYVELDSVVIYLDGTPITAEVPTKTTVRVVRRGYEVYLNEHLVFRANIDECLEQEQDGPPEPGATCHDFAEHITSIQHARMFKFWPKTLVLLSSKHSGGYEFRYPEAQRILDQLKADAKRYRETGKFPKPRKPGERMRVTDEETITAFAKR